MLRAYRIDRRTFLALDHDLGSSRTGICSMSLTTALAGDSLDSLNSGFTESLLGTIGRSAFASMSLMLVLRGGGGKVERRRITNTLHLVIYDTTYLGKWTTNPFVHGGSGVGMRHIESTQYLNRGHAVPPGYPRPTHQNWPIIEKER